MKNLINYYKKIIIESMEHGALEHDYFLAPGLIIPPTTELPPGSERPIGFGSGNPRNPDNRPVRPGTGIRPIKWQPLTPFFDPNAVVNNPRPYVPDNRRKR